MHSQEWATPAGKTISSLPLAAVEEAEEEEGRGLGDVSRGEGWRGSRGEVREDSEHPPQSTWRRGGGKGKPMAYPEKTIGIIIIMRERHTLGFAVRDFEPFPFRLLVNRDCGVCRLMRLIIICSGRGTSCLIW